MASSSCVFIVWLMIVRALMLITVKGGISLGADASNSEKGFTFLGSLMRTSNRHQVAYFRSVQVTHSEGWLLLSPRCTHRLLSHRYAALNIQPTRTHDLSLDDQHLKGTGVRTEDFAKGGSAEVTRQLWLYDRTSPVFSQSSDQLNAR
jgi:hypothetical protein